MSQVDELLDNLSEDEWAAYTTEPETEGHIVIGNDRFITVPDKLKRIAVESDHDVETVTFDCPRYWDGIDLSAMVIYINYRLPNNEVGSYLVDKVAIDESDDTIMHFDWVISGNVTVKKGNIAFLVCAKSTDDDGNVDRHWNSELNADMYISEGLETVETILDAYPDLITQLLMYRDKVKVSGIYVGSGDMPEGYNVQIDPDGAAFDEEEFLKQIESAAGLSSVVPIIEHSKAMAIPQLYAQDSKNATNEPYLYPCDRTDGYMEHLDDGGAGPAYGEFAKCIAIRNENGNLLSELPQKKNEVANKAYVDNVVGDVEAALDGIIAIQNSLIGGEGV